MTVSHNAGLQAALVERLNLMVNVSLRLQSQHLGNEGSAIFVFRDFLFHLELMKGNKC